MKLNPERILEIFSLVLQKPPAERGNYLADACQGDLDLRQQVESLLQAHEQAGEFLGQTVQLPPASFVVECAGTMIGRYKLLEPIGEGGFGTVWMAEQEEPVRRRVALKVIKAGMDTKQVLARFEAERQALAMMDHPSIARVFDGGATETGRPYFVMELVRGERITDYCDEHKLPMRERLALFIQVCQAVQHAHQKGIIHRDLKPSNILVTEVNGAPVPKVIDFGVAKATQTRLTELTLFTGLHQMIGTPAYMSPEQAGLGALDMDTRSDIYALGVLLYELLTGHTPLNKEDFEKVGWDEVFRLIREQDPPKPSTRLSALTREQLTSIAVRRQTEPVKLNRLLTGDLDWIVMKCLEKDRRRRYETANGLASDLQRHVNNETVMARPPSNLYRFQKLVRRNKLVFAAASAVTAALVIGLGLSTWMFFKEKAARQQAVESEKIAKEEASLLSEAWAGSYDNHHEAQMILRKTLAMQRKLLGNANPAVLRSMNLLGLMVSRDGNQADAEAMFRNALVQARKLPTEGGGREAPSVALLLHHLAMVLDKRQTPKDALPKAEEAVDMYRRHPDWPANERNHAYQILIQILTELEDLPKAEGLYREQLAMERKESGEEDPRTVSAIFNLATSLQEQKKLSEAESVFRDGLAIEQKRAGGDPSQASENFGIISHHLADVLREEKKLGEARSLAEESINMYQLHPEWPAHEKYHAVQVLGGILKDLHDFAALQTLYRSAAEQGYVFAQYNLGWMYDKGEGVAKDPVEAAKWYRKAADQGNAYAQYYLGYMYQNGEGMAKDPVESGKWYRKAADQFRKTTDQSDGEAQRYLGWMYQYGEGMDKDPVEAAKWYRKAADQGNAEAQCYIGFMYQNGEGVAKDPVEADKWHRKAADQGNAEAQSQLGYMYQNGQGVAKDPIEAIKWYRKSAEQGDAYAQNNLGWIFATGQGVAKDPAEAIKWYRKSAEQGYADAENNMGGCYENGWGVEKDLAEALKWYRKSAEQGNPNAKPGFARLENKPK